MVGNNYLYKLVLFTFALLLLYLCRCKSTEDVKDKKLSAWRQQLLNDTYVKSLNNQDYFISLGISKDKELKQAEEKARIESSFQMPELIETFITTFQQYSEQSETIELDSLNNSLVYAHSEINVPEINHETVAIFEHNGLYYVAVNGKVRRDKCNETLAQLYNNSISSRLKDFRENINKLFNKISKTIYLK